MIELLILALVMAFVVGHIAESKGRGGGRWFLFGLVLWPIALVLILLAPRTPQAALKRARAEGRFPCPFCAELVKAEARLCPQCRSDLAEGWAVGQPAAPPYRWHGASARPDAFAPLIEPRAPRDSLNRKER